MKLWCDVLDFPRLLIINSLGCPENRICHWQHNHKVHSTAVMSFWSYLRQQMELPCCQGILDVYISVFFSERLKIRGSYSTSIYVIWSVNVGRTVELYRGTLCYSAFHSHLKLMEEGKMVQVSWSCWDIGLCNIQYDQKANIVFCMTNKVI